jgi:Rrf2 family protein
MLTGSVRIVMFFRRKPAYRSFMPLFTSKLDYALRALLDLATQPPGRPAQSREIASRQDVPESYLNQLLVILRRAGLVRSVRGAGGGYILNREPHQVTVIELVEALHGPDFLGERTDEGAATTTGWVFQNLQRRVGGTVRRELEKLSLEDLVQERRKLDEAQSLMLGL